MYAAQSDDGHVVKDQDKDWRAHISRGCVDTYIKVLQMEQSAQTL